MSGSCGLGQAAPHLTVEVTIRVRCIHNTYSNFSNFRITTFKLEVDLLVWRVTVVVKSISRCVDLCVGVQFYEGQNVWGFFWLFVLP